MDEIERRFAGNSPNRHQRTSAILRLSSRLPRIRGRAVSIAMEDDRFDPKTITIAAGTTVTWTNTGGDWHSVAAFDGSFESDQIAPGDSYSYTFTTPGEYSYICKHHGRQGMIGKIIVTE